MAECELYQINDFLKKYPISRSTFYREVKDKRIKITKVRKRSYVTHDDAEAWLANARTVS